MLTRTTIASLLCVLCALAPGPPTKATLRVLADSIPVDLDAERIVPLDPASGALAVEPSVAIHDSVIVVSWNDSHGGHIEKPSHDVGTAISLDRGRTFSPRGFLPRSSVEYASGGDSRVVATPNGDFFIVTLAHQRRGELRQDLELYALRAPAYEAWQFVARIARGKALVDKPALTVGSDGALTAAFTLDAHVVHSTSRNGGTTWTEPVAVSADLRRTRSGEDVRACGSDVTVAWMEGIPAGDYLLNEVWSAESRDNGKVFSPPALYFRLTQTVKVPRGYSLGPGMQNGFINNDVGVSCAPPLWRQRANLLVTLDGGQDSLGLPFSHVLLFASGTAGNSSPALINLTKDDGKLLRVFPSFATTSRTVGVLYYEVAQDAARTLVEPILRIRDEAGKASRVLLAEQPTDWRTMNADLEFATGQANAGDYISLASDGTRFVAAWTDGREGRSRIHVRVVTPR